MTRDKLLELIQAEEATRWITGVRLGELVAIGLKLGIMPKSLGDCVGISAGGVRRWARGPYGLTVNSERMKALRALRDLLRTLPG